MGSNPVGRTIFLNDLASRLGRRSFFVGAIPMIEPDPPPLLQSGPRMAL